MGGKGSGGLRVGAGRPRKNQIVGFAAVIGSSAGTGGVDLMPAPAGIGEKTAAHWNRLGPHAVAARTLVEATAGDFLELCELLVEADDVRAERRAEGWTARGLCLSKEYRGLVQRAEAKLRAFRLAPMGKEMIAAKPEADPFSEFDEPAGGAAAH